MILMCLHHQNHYIDEIMMYMDKIIENSNMVEANNFLLKNNEINIINEDNNENNNTLSKDERVVWMKALLKITKMISMTIIILMSEVLIKNIL